MNRRQTRGADGCPPDAVRSIAWLDCDANLKVALKTRRAVRDAVISTRERRTRHLRITGVALVGFLFLLVMLAPAIWNGLEDLLAGEHISDLPTMVAVLTVMLLSAMLAALIAVWKGQQDVEHDRGGLETFRSIEK
jgi:uncharacterized membrane protein YozB (DUF420 family)